MRYVLAKKKIFFKEIKLFTLFIYFLNVLSIILILKNGRFDLMGEAYFFLRLYANVRIPKNDAVVSPILSILPYFGIKYQFFNL